MARGSQRVEHLLRRAGFGASPAEVEAYGAAGYNATLEQLIDFESVPDDVDQKITQPGYVQVTPPRGSPFQPNTVINDARQRWLFRMVHTGRPLQEKMALFWHNHFATAYSKINTALGSSTDATRMMAAKPSEDSGRMRGQIELFRQYTLGNFRDLLIEVAKDPAMLVWLDGRLNFRRQPQENFARELMELFTMGVGFFTEPDVYAGARVFTGWNLRRAGADTAVRQEFFYDPAQHETTAKTFSFAISPDGGRTIPARSAADGMQDGIDLINAVARHPETPRRLARRLYAFFISETDQPSESFLARVSAVYFSTGYDMRAVVRAVLESAEFNDPSRPFQRYSWPVEFVVRALKEVGWSGYSVNDALAPLINMGLQLYEPPDVNGWDLGRGWFSSGSMLARINFAATLTTNQRFALRDQARAANASPEALIAWTLDRLSPAPYDDGPYRELFGYATSGISRWTGSDADLLSKAGGLVHLVLGSSEYQLV